jgi:hypothetical protein
MRGLIKGSEAASLIVAATRIYGSTHSYTRL